MSPLLRNTLITLAALVALAAGFATHLWWRASQLDQSQAELADFALTDLQGKERWLSEWHGKTVILNFWATWCAPCKEEIPLLVQTHKRHQNQGVEVVGVAIDTHEAVSAYAKQMNIGYPLLVGDDAVLSVMARYGNPKGALPYTVILGPDGAILAKKLGAYKKGELETAISSVVNRVPATNMHK
jgi:thiol-disulfide isomerase/thioredoxin